MSARGNTSFIDMLRRGSLGVLHSPDKAYLIRRQSVVEFHTGVQQTKCPPDAKRSQKGQKTECSTPCLRHFIENSRLFWIAIPLVAPAPSHRHSDLPVQYYCSRYELKPNILADLTLGKAASWERTTTTSSFIWLADDSASGLISPIRYRRRRYAD
jgi:hypothetical protein